MSAFTDIKNVRKQFRKLDSTGQALVLEMLRDDVNASRAAKARAGKSKGGRKKGSKNKVKEQPQPISAAS